MADPAPSQTHAAPPRTVHLLGVPVHALTTSQAAERVLADLGRGAGGWIVTPNLDILRRATRDPGFRRVYDLTTLKLPDGMPLVWASRLRRTALAGRAAGSDLIFDLCARAAREGASVYFLGGNPGTAERAARELAVRYPGLRVAGTDCPPLGFERQEELRRGVEQRLIAADPGIILVALGSPKQEFLIESLRGTLPRAWFVGVGITFSFVAGEVRRAPRWMRATGMEWVHRLAQEPRRLARRYLVDGIPFALRLLAVSACEGLTGARTPPPPGGPKTGLQP